MVRPNERYKPAKPQPKSDHPDRERFWTRSGNIRRLPDRQALEQAIRYVRDGQGAPL